MGASRIPPQASDDEARALLARYACPIPFHAVRTRFLGNIATPNMAASPVGVLHSLWGGELPVFSSQDAVNELMRVLVMGMWNRLSQHQERSAPFRLTRQEVSQSREGLRTLARTRLEELDGFFEGFFADAESLDLPERAHRGIHILGDLRGIYAAIVDLLQDETKPTPVSEIEVTLRHIRDTTRIAEHEMHEIVLACKRARRQFLETMPLRRPTVH